MNPRQFKVSGAGLGLRRAIIGPLLAARQSSFDFIEVAPENWIGVGGKYGKQLAQMSERYPLLCHGLSLSLGGPNPLDETFLIKVKRFLDQHNVRIYSEHLSYCTDNAHLYDLMPIPFTAEAAKHVAQRIMRTQDILGRRIAIENVSYYTPLNAQMSELDFIQSVLEQADCDLLLDVNNIYVNSINHRYDALDFMRALPKQRVAYFHVAGHYNEADDLIVDTHGAAVIDPVWKILEQAYAHFGAVPTLLERDFNFPAMPELFAEVNTIRELQSPHLATSQQNTAQAHHG